jgi:hypothetical protein
VTCASSMTRPSSKRTRSFPWCVLCSRCMVCVWLCEFADVFVVVVVQHTHLQERKAMRMFGKIVRDTFRAQVCVCLCMFKYAYVSVLICTCTHTHRTTACMITPSRGTTRRACLLLRSHRCSYSWCTTGLRCTKTPRGWRSGGKCMSLYYVRVIMQNGMCMYTYLRTHAGDCLITH